MNVQFHNHQLVPGSNLHIKRILKRGLLLFLAIAMIGNPCVAENKVVVAKNGDGITKILIRNGFDPERYTAEFIELNKKKIGKNNTLFIGMKYKLPEVIGDSTNVVLETSAVDSAAKNQLSTYEVESLAKESSVATSKINTPKTIDYNLFGPKYKSIEIKSDELKGAIFYLKSGHGGPDPGAMGKYEGHTVCEDEYAYDVTLRIAKNLVEKGAKVYMITIDKNDGIRDESYLTPDHDEVCYPNKTIPLNQTKRLQQRVETINQLYKQNGNSYQRFISIHVDSRSKSENIDIFFYYDIRSKTGKKAATTLQRTFRDKYKEVQPTRGYQGTVSARNLYVLKNSLPVGIYIELANMNHQRDIKRLIIPDNRQAVANWLTLGLIKDFKNSR